MSQYLFSFQGFGFPMLMNVRTEQFELKKPFTIARGTSYSADVLTVELSRGGYTGRGEGAPQARYSQTTESVMRQVNDLRAEIEGGISRMELQALLPAGAARNAIDCAMWDLEAKASGRSIWDISGVAEPSGPLSVDITIGIGDPSEMQEAASEHRAFEIGKVKLNNELVEARLAAVRRGAPDMRVFVDVNEGWSLEELRQYMPILLEYRVELLEQPLPRGEDAGLELFQSPIPICADESCFDRRDLPDLIGKYDYINIKLDKTGGLTEAIALLNEARKSDLRVMVGCMKGTSLAMAPGFLLGAMCDYRDLDAPTMLVADRPHAMKIENGYIYPFDSALWG
jgi:L-alanine-DL-glutamate epimerase-like enolase superfamily enzyme